MGRVLLKATRASDIVARYGGDEFAVILPQTPVENIGIVIDRIYDLMKEQSIDGKDGKIDLRCSIGASSAIIQTFEQEDIPRPLPQGYYEEMSKSMIAGADSMLYEAKKIAEKSGVNGIEVPWPDFQAIAREAR